MLRIGMLTSGGDCQGLNAAMRGVAKALYEAFDEVEIIGILDGYRGLIQNRTRLMKPEDFSGILTLGGTMLGTSRTPFKLMRVIEEDGVDKVAAMKDTVKKPVSYTHLSRDTAHADPKTAPFPYRRSSARLSLSIASSFVGTKNTSLPLLLSNIKSRSGRLVYPEKSPQMAIFIR